MIILYNKVCSSARQMEIEEIPMNLYKADDGFPYSHLILSLVRLVCERQRVLKSMAVFNRNLGKRP
jgi:hypothetical protein